MRRGSGEPRGCRRVVVDADARPAGRLGRLRAVQPGDEQRGAVGAAGGGSAADYVGGLHDALLAGAGLAAIGVVATALLISGRFGTAGELDETERTAPLRLGDAVPVAA
jgi:hypothetical protein